MEQRADPQPWVGVAGQEAHLVSGPLNLYRHYEVRIVDWLEGRRVNEVSRGETRSLGKPRLSVGGK